MPVPQPKPSPSPAAPASNPKAPRTKRAIREYFRHYRTDYTPLIEQGETILRTLEGIIRRDAGNIIGQRAVRAVGYIGGKRAARILARSARSKEDTIRIVTAVALRQIAAEQAVPTLLRLLDDDDPSVVKMAVRSSAGFDSQPLRTKLEQISKEHTYEFLQKEATKALKPE